MKENKILTIVVIFINIIEYKLSGKTPSFVDIPLWHTHSIQNIGEEDLLTLFWINEPYNEQDSDTFFENV